jgi:2-polyprenyl-3-methyl-5-hydroxy-6-metoxy-1,4-benzoquinol methylase
MRTARNALRPLYSGSAARRVRFILEMGYFDRLWGMLPDVEPEHFTRRRDFLLAALTPGASVIDVGCGAGAFAEALAREGFSVVGVDVAAEAVRRARERVPGVEFRVCGADELPCASHSFDAAWLGEVLEHVQDGLGLLAEVERVLRPGGLAIVTTPDHGALLRLRLGLSRRAFERHFEPRSDHVRFFTPRSLGGLLAAADFERVAVARGPGLLLATARAAG